MNCIICTSSCEVTVSVTGDEGPPAYLTRFVSLPFHPYPGLRLNLAGETGLDDDLVVEKAIWDAPRGVWLLEMEDEEVSGAPWVFAIASRGVWILREDM